MAFAQRATTHKERAKGEEIRGLYELSIAAPPRETVYRDSERIVQSTKERGKCSQVHVSHWPNPPRSYRSAHCRSGIASTYTKHNYSILTRFSIIPIIYVLAF